MDAITLSAVVGEDRKLVIELPAEMPIGPVELVIRTATPSPASKNGEDLFHDAAREAAHAKLSAAGKLVTHFDFGLPEDYTPLTPEERMEIGTLPPDARPSEDIINEERGEY